MEPDWNDASTPWRQAKTATSSVRPSARTYTASSSKHSSHSRFRGHGGSVKGGPMTAFSTKESRAPPGTRSAGGLASVGLGTFKIGALHDFIQAGHGIADEEDDGFHPETIPVPQTFYGFDPGENRPPGELFMWGEEHRKEAKGSEQERAPCAGVEACALPAAAEEDSASLPSLQRSATWGGRSCAVSGTKRKVLVTTGSETILCGDAKSNRSRCTASRGASTQGNRRHNFSAVRGTDGTWQFVARARSVRETPVSRRDAFELAQEFEAAMAVIDAHGCCADGGMGSFASPLQNDMHSLQDEVCRTFGSREALAEAVQIMDREASSQALCGQRRNTKQEASRWGGDERVDQSPDGKSSDDGHEKEAAEPSPLSLTGKWVRNAIGLGPKEWASAQRVLGSCLFEQKWLDLTSGELCEQVGVACLPHGRLLQEIRRRNASTFHRLHALYSDLLWMLDRCVASLLGGRRERKQAEEDWTSKLEVTCNEYEARIKAIHDARGSDQLEQVRAKREAKAQVDRMGDTLRTLNGIFKTMQADGKAMTEVDLKDRCRVLELELAARKEEMHELRALKEKSLASEAEMQRMKRELESTKAQAARVTEEMERRQSLLQELMDGEAKRLTEIEALKAGMATCRGGACDDGQGHDRGNARQELVVGTKRDKGGGLNDRLRRARTFTPGDNASAFTGARASGRGLAGGDGTVRKEDYDEEEEEEEEIGSSVLCIKCRKALDDLSNIADALEKERQLKGQVRLQCHGYRLLLPNLKGYRPPRTMAWVRTVMRAILRAKVWDDSVLRYKQDLRVRFPEFVYSWFEPPREEMVAANASGRSKLVAQADDDRWGLYYGVKALARESAEATIFWHALNETNGEDYLTFTVYCLSIVEGTAGPMLRQQWGVSETCTNVFTLRRKIDEGRAAKDRTARGSSGEELQGTLDDGSTRGNGEAYEPLASGRDVVWLCFTDAVAAVDHVLIKALEDQKRKVLDATKAISVSCEGRLPEEHASSTCVDLFLFLRIMLHSFREEQVNRRAAVRLMFETAATGVLTDGTPIYGDGRVDQSALAAAQTVYNNLLNESKATVDLPQYMVIARTLWPQITTADAVAVFRDAHEETNGEVDFQAFLKLADRWQFFSNALQLPVHMPARTDLGEGLDATTKNNLGALVHRHYNLMQSTVEEVKDCLPESAVEHLVRCQRAVERELQNASAGAPAPCSATDEAQDGLQAQRRESTGSSNSSTKSGSGAVLSPSPGQPTMSLDGTRPLAAYRRLLATLYHVRNVRHESGPGYEPHPGKGANVVQKTEAEFQALEAVFFDLRVDPRFRTYEKIRRRLAATRVQRAWREKLARCCELPLGMLALVRPGYLRGSGGIVSRAVHFSPHLVQAQIADFYTAKLRIDSQIGRHGMPLQGAASGPSRRPFFWVTFEHILQQWGTPELAERAAHDMFFNVRSLAPALSRVRLFGAFSGCLPPETAGPSFEGDAELRDEEALEFYLRAVATFHRVRDEMTAAKTSSEGQNAEVTAMGTKDDLESYLSSLRNAGDGLSAVAGDGSALELSAVMGGDGAHIIEELFPVTVHDQRTKRHYWYESAPVAETVAKELFDKCSQPPSAEKNGSGSGSLRARVSDVQMSLGKLMGHPAMTGGKDTRVDVDDVLWLFMKHWTVVRRHRRGLLDRALGLAPAFPSAPSTAVAGPASPSALASVDSFRAAVSCFEKLARSAVPRAAADLVHGDAYLEALTLSRQREGKALSHVQAAKTAILSSPLLLWDVSGARQEQGRPPAFSIQASRTWLLTYWSRYSEAFKREIPLLAEELQPPDPPRSEVDEGKLEEHMHVERVEVDAGEEADGPIDGTPLAPEQAAMPFVDGEQREKLLRELKKANAEVLRLDGYMEGLAKVQEQAQVRSRILHGGAGEEKTGHMDIPPEVEKKYARPGLERASKEMRSLMTALSSVYRQIRPRDPRDFVADAWSSGRRASIRRTSFNSY